MRFAVRSWSLAVQRSDECSNGGDVEKPKREEPFSVNILPVSKVFDGLLLVSKWLPNVTIPSSSESGKLPFCVSFEPLPLPFSLPILGLIPGARRYSLSSLLEMVSVALHW